MLTSFALLLGLTVPGPVAQAQATAAICPADLGPAVDAIADRPEWSQSRFGVHVETEPGEVLVSRQGDQFFLPASNMKLFTTAAALTALGPEFTLRTSVYGAADGSSLRVVGRGDPGLTTADLEDLAQQLADRGIQQVAELLVDDHWFPGDPYHPNWEWEDVQAGYGAPTNSLILNRNALFFTLTPQAEGEPLVLTWDDPEAAADWQIDNRSVTVGAGESEFLSVGRDLTQPLLRLGGQLVAGSDPARSSVAVSQPTPAFLDQFQRVLAQADIGVVRGAIAAAPADPLPSELAAVNSAPLADLLVDTNQWSRNIYAEALLKTLGRLSDPDTADATTAGSTAVSQILATLGIDADGYILADGSGLSRHNLATPATLVALLQAMTTHPRAATYRDSLAVAGVSGTLRNRFTNTPAAETLIGKTGSLSGNTALSGYLDPPDHAPVTFSIMINHGNQSGVALRQAVDEVVALLTQLRPC
jgi:D-alanyl-D-alanine carboxypeptidase/D-alanyl-D-alanine-endopeptidase (penicillin-binding protein 4)